MPRSKWTVRPANAKDGSGAVLFEDARYVGGFDFADKANEIARKLNAFDKMLAALKDAQSVLDGEHPDWADFHGPEFESITSAIAKAEAANV